MTTIETHTQATNGKLPHHPKSDAFAPLAAELRAIRKAMKLSQTELGTLLGVSGQAISLWENNNPPHGPHWRMIDKFLYENRHLIKDKPEPKQEQVELDYAKQDEPQTFVLKRRHDAPLRFTGFKLGSMLVSDSEVLDLYKTKNGTVVWDYDGLVSHGSTQRFAEYWSSASEAGAVFAFANECGLEIFEDIE